MSINPSRHTPGPWYIRQVDRQNRFGIQSTRDEHVCHVDASRFPDQRHDPEMEANARLIAEAPAMLEVLRDLHRAMAHGEGSLLLAADAARAILARIDEDA